MPTYTITIKMDNAAFADREGPELGRILKDLATRLDNSDQVAALNVTLRDANGNVVGEAERTWRPWEEATRTA